MQPCPPYSLLKASESVKRGYLVWFSVKEGTNKCCQNGVEAKLCRLCGVYIPSRFSSTGGLCCPLLRPGPVSPSTVPEKIQKMVCVLDMDCECHASASESNFRPFGASTDTLCGRVFPVYPHATEKPGGIPPWTIFRFTLTCVEKQPKQN